MRRFHLILPTDEEFTYTVYTANDPWATGEEDGEEGGGVTGVVAGAEEDGQG